MKNLLINCALAAKKKKLFSLFLALVASVSAIYASNKQVDGIWYDFDHSSKTATVTYRGSSYSSYSNEYTGDIVIPASVTYNGITYSVTSIGDYAFYECSKLTSITIPNSVTSIGKRAFSYCSSLTSITIPNSVTSIGDYAFSVCSSLTSVTIGNSVTSIGYTAFGGCSSLTSPVYNAHCFAYMPSSYSGAYTIPNGIESIAGGAFQYCRSLSSITIPNSVTSIEDGAFGICTGLTSVTLNSNAIVSKYYSEDSNLKTIFGGQVTEYIIGDSVTSIGNYAFYNCTGLTSITIPNSVTYIGYNAFDYCSGLTSVHISDIAAWCAIDGSRCNPMYYAHNLYLNGELVTDLVIPNSVTSIGEEAFYGCSSLTSVTIPSSVTSIGADAFHNCTGLTSVHISDIAAWCAIFFTDNPLKYAHNLYLNGELVTDLVIPNSVTSIPYQAFQGCTSLTSVTIPNSVTSIRGWAFRGCSSLTSVTIPNSVTSIGEWAFYDCSSLTSVTIPNSVTSIGEWAFYNCSSLTSVIWNAKECSDFTDQSPFIRRITSFIFGDEVEYIPANLCSGFSNLTSIIIPNSVDSIGGSAFRECTSLTSVTIGDSVTSIGGAAFYGCTSLTSVTIEAETPPTLGSEVFYNTNNCPIYVPCNAVYAYRAAWSNYADRIYGNCASSYTVRFLNWDGSVLQSTQVEEGKMPQYTGTTPTKPDDAQYTYTFSGWTPQIVAATADATYTATFTATEIPSEECTDVNATWLQTGGSGLGEITTDNSGVWFYDAQYGAKASKQGGYTGYLMTPAKDLRGMKSVTLSFMHTHKFAGTPSNELTLWVTPDYKGSVETSQWQQLTIAPYAANTNWTFVSVSINVPVSKVGANTVFAFKYMSTASNYATWEIQNLTLIAECEGSTPPQPTSYTIKFKNWDGSVLQSTQVEEGKMPQYTGATPTRPDDSQYTYTFSGWTPQIVAATADATYTATFTATEIPSEECGVNATWLQTGGSGLGEITTDNSGVWKYEYQYGACAKANSGETGWLLTPAKDLRGMKSVNLSFLHVHKYAGTFTNDMTLWVCANYKGSVSASQWQQLTITPYSTNNNWTFVSVSINVPLNMVGANTVFGFKYISSTSSAKWQIKELNLNAECAKADETTTTDVTATPNEDNSVTLTWPAVNGADTYTIEIKKNGVLVCTLVFNANGQLISINFAAPARDGKGRNVPAAEQSANGWTYVVTGLEGNASYTYTVTAKDVNGNVLLKQSVDFSTGEEQGIEDVLSDQVQCTKVIRNGQVFILRNGKTYTMQGQEVK